MTHKHWPTYHAPPEGTGVVSEFGRIAILFDEVHEEWRKYETKKTDIQSREKFLQHTTVKYRTEGYDSEAG